jgi:PBSX family phage terminase large subunit
VSAALADQAWARWKAMSPDERQRVLDHPGFKIKPIARGKQKDSFALSEPGLATGHLWEGTVRSGKTIVSILRWIRFIRSGPPGNLAMIGKTERTLKRNVIDTIVALLGQKAVKYRQGAGEVEICGRRVYIAGANDEGAVAKIQGMTLVGWYGDEVPTWPKAVFDMARTRLSDPGAEWFATGNPASSTHHLKVDWIDRAKLHLDRDGTLRRRPAHDKDTQDIHVYSFTLYDNREFLTEKFIQITERSYTGMFYQRYILGRWCMAEGAIYDSWDPAKHVVRRAPAIERWISVGIDHGTTNPFSAIATGLGPHPSGRGKALYATAEWRYDSTKTLRRKTDLEYADALRGWLPQRAEMPDGGPERVAVDPSANGFRQQLYRHGITSTAADNDVLAGIGTMHSIVERGKFFVVEGGCPDLIREFPDYAWDPAAAAKGLDRPIKSGDHSLDAERYGTHTGKSSWWYDVFPDELEAVLEGRLTGV